MNKASGQTGHAVPFKNRRSIRLKGYDYFRAGAYFVPICVQNRQCLFGDIADGEMVLNDAGRMVEKWVVELKKFPDIQCDASIVIPNHFHAIIINVGANLCVRPDRCVCPDQGAYPDNEPNGTTGADCMPCDSPTNDHTSGEH